MGLGRDLFGAWITGLVEFRYSADLSQARAGDAVQGSRRLRKDPHRRKRLTPLALSGASGGDSANHLLCDTGIAWLQVSAGPNPPPLVPAAWDCRSVFFGKPMPARLLLFSLYACTRLTTAGQAATPAGS
jgi:hypothetical protein